MKNLWIVLKFELFNFLKNKVFKISTIILSLLIIIGLSVPTIMDAFGKPLFGDDKADNIPSEGVHISYGILVEDKSVNMEDIKSMLPDIDVISAGNREELNNMVNSDDIVAGFVITTPTKYEYLVKNTSANNSNRYRFEDVMLNLYRNNALLEKGIDSNAVAEIYNVPIEYETTVLGKDSMKNYLYTYILIFGLYFVIMFYGQLIATAEIGRASCRERV